MTTFTVPAGIRRLKVAHKHNAQAWELPDLLTFDTCRAGSWLPLLSVAAAAAASITGEMDDLSLN